MAYSEVEDVRQVLTGRAEDQNETPALLSNDQIEYAINSADAQIDAGLRKRYKLPFAEDAVPRLVHMLSVDIAAYLTSLIFLNSAPMENDDPAARRYDRARRLLDDLRFGRVDLDAIERIDMNGDGFESSIFQDYSNPLFGTQHIFGEWNPPGVIPADREYR